MNTTPATPAAASGNDVDAKITKQGDLIRDLKAKKASKDDITKEVQVLLALKAEYKAANGKDWAPSVGSAPAPRQEKAPKPEKPKQEPKKKVVKEEGEKKQTRLGLEAKKEENLPDWYSQVKIEISFVLILLVQKISI